MSFPAEEIFYFEHYFAFINNGPQMKRIERIWTDPFVFVLSVQSAVYFLVLIRL